MNHPILNSAVKLFLQDLHPDLIKLHNTAFLGGWATWIKTHYPEIWSEFSQHVKATYRLEGLNEYLLP